MPKKETKGTAIASKMWCLIFWTASKQSDVVPVSSLPPKARKVNSEAKVDYVHRGPDGKVVKKAKYDARVLKLHADRSYLEGLQVSPEGEVYVTPKKVFSASTMIEKKQSKVEKSQRELAELKSHHNSQISLQSGCSVFRTPNLPAATNSMAVDEDSLPDGSDSEEQYELIEEVSQESSLDPILKTLIPEDITYENICFLERLVQAMKRAHRSDSKTDTFSSKVDLSAFKKEGTGREPFFPDSVCYLPASLKEDFELNAVTYDVESGDQVNDWKALVRQILVHIYGDQLKYHCAKGREGSRPGIDKTIHTQLYRYAKKFSEDVSEKEFNVFVNSLCHNKRCSSGFKPKSKPNKSKKVDIENTAPEDKTLEKADTQKQDAQPPMNPGQHQNQNLMHQGVPAHGPAAAPPFPHASGAGQPHYPFHYMYPPPPYPPVNSNSMMVVVQVDKAAGKVRDQCACPSSS